MNRVLIYPNRVGLSSKRLSSRRIIRFQSSALESKFKQRKEFKFSKVDPKINLAKTYYDLFGVDLGLVMDSEFTVGFQISATFLR